MSQRFYAGADWSGKPHERNDLFIFCVVALSDAEAWDSSCRQLRQRLKMPPNREFHARHMGKGSHKLEFLTAGQEAGMRVGAFIIDTNSEKDELASLTHESAAMELLHQFLPVCPFHSFWYDKGDLKGEKAEKAFETEICRYNRTLYPSSPLETKCRKSNNSNLIQLADVMAYAFRTLERGTLKDPQLKLLLREINRDKRNLIIRR